MRKEQPICDKIAFLYFTLIRFGENHSLNLVLLAVAHEGDLVGVLLAVSEQFLIYIEPGYASHFQHLIFNGKQTKHNANLYQM